VLIVEDDPEQRRVLALIVRTRGHEAVACGTLAEARAADPCDLALVDRRLPDGDGMELVRSYPGRAYLITGQEPAPGDPEAPVLIKPIRPADLDALLG
jgi:DNA-binding NtrC family response regulator